MATQQSVLVLVLMFLVFQISEQKNALKAVIEKMSFLISVNHDDHIFQRCSATSQTPMLDSDGPLNKTNAVNISGCDSGKFMFDVKHPHWLPDPRALLVVNVHFYSSYLDNPVVCSIPWNISYQFPAGPKSSSLPGCFTKTVQLVDNALYMEHCFYFKIYDWIPHDTNAKPFLHHSELK
ncbi:uncharacterized protein LOC125652305 [Ostrea edulis]|uniref:uncharacterized protein LOC125652305 n=1 Tax=Ostrea edulis TaxID=37623 RepID=UPI0024AEECE2|nr:uncharacterized protein LOC125652305 [Ostrea edulis]